MAYLSRILRVWAFCMAFCLAFCVAWWGASPLLYAQANTEPFVNIIDMNTRQFPRVEVTVAGGALPQPIADLPLELWENQQAQPLVSDQTVQVGLQSALLIDAKNIAAIGAVGQSHHEVIARTVLGLIEQNIFLRQEDQLAVYAIGTGGGPGMGLQTIQAWTDEPNLIFNSIVQTTPATSTTETDLGNGLLLTLAQFQESDFPFLAKSIVLFATGSNLSEMEEIVAKANALHVRIYVVDLAGAPPPDPAANRLSQLAARSQGQYFAAQTGVPVDSLGIALTEIRSRRIVAYQSNAPAPVEVRLQLTGGGWLTASISMAMLNDNAAPVNTLALTDTTSIASATAQTSGQGADQTAPTENLIAIPGTALFFPRPMVIGALGLLILFLVYLLYSEMRTRQSAQSQTPLNGISAGAMQGEETNPVLYDGDAMPSDDAFLESFGPTPQEDALGFEQVHWDASSTRQARQNGYHTNGLSSGPTSYSVQMDARRGNHSAPKDTDEEIDDDGVTYAPPEDGDDDVTYRLGEIKPPLLGCLVRETDEQSLPAELPIYKVNCVGDEPRYMYIGRHSKNSVLVIKSKYISREHAVLVQRGNRLYIRDNASTAGTFVNGQKLEPDKELLLRNNDRIDFGIVAYIFRAADPVEPQLYDLADERVNSALVRSSGPNPLTRRRMRTA